MPVAATMTDVTNITYSNASNIDLWRMQVRSVGGVNILGTYTNVDVLQYSDGVEVASNIELGFETITDPVNIAAGETFTISHDSTSIVVYCSAITTSPAVYYVDTNGVLYSDSALTTAVTPDFDSVSEILTNSEDQTETPTETASDVLTISETTSTESSNSVNDQLSISESTSYRVDSDDVTFPIPSVTYLGSNPYDTDNPIFDSRMVAETDPVVGKEVMVFIRDDNDEWVDFSDRFEQRGKNKLIDFGNIKHSTEKRGGLPLVESTIGTLTLDNTDGFFDGRVKSLITESGNTASFESSSSSGTETSWRRRETKFELHLTLIDDSILIRGLGVFLIKELDTVLGKENQVRIKLESKMNLLKRADASIVKDGMQWYRNKSMNFLVRELLKTQFSDENDELPDSFYVNSQISLPVPSDIGDGIAYSIFGVPPEDETGHNTEVSYIRAMDIWTWNTGTISSASDNTYLVTSSTVWGAEGTSGALRPRSGDVIIIKDSSNGNDGEYEIRSVNADLINLVTPLKGSIESSMSYTVSRLYLIHKDSELWEFQPQTNSYTLIYDFAQFLWIWGHRWKAVPYKIYISDNRVNVLFCHKPTYGYTGVYGYEGDDWDFHYRRRFIYDGSSTEIANQTVYGGSSHSSVPMAVKAPMGNMTSLTTFHYGEGIQVPFTQMFRGSTNAHACTIENRNDVPDPDQVFVPGTGLSEIENHDYIAKGWHCIQQNSTIAGDTNFIDQFWIFWDRGPFDIWVEDWTSIVTLTSFDSANNYQALIYLLNTNTSSRNTASGTYNTDWWAQGICLAYTDNTNATYGDRVYASILWTEDKNDFTAVTEAVCTVSSFGSSGGTITTQWSETDKTIIDLCQYGSSTSPTNPGFLVSMMLREADDDQWYEIGTRQWNGATWDYTTLRRSASPFIKLTKGGVNEDYDVFVFHKYENRLLRYDHSAEVLVAMAAGNEVVEGDGSICSPLVIDKYTRSSTDIIYGVSWSGEDPWALDGLRLPNKGVLWKLDTFINPFIELADFDGLNVADAIGKLAQACNHVALFNVSGDFFFIQKELVDSEDYIIEHVEGRSLISSNVKKDRGYGEIYNHFTITPSIVQLTEVEWEMILIKREENEDDRDFTQFVEVNSLNNLKRKVRLVCINGGLVSESPLFKYLVEYDNIDARVGQEVEAADLEILLSSTFGGDQLTGGVHTGDFIIFTHPDDGTQIIKEILGGRGQGRITSVSGTVVNVNNVSIYKLGDKIKLVSSTDIFKSIIVSITDNSLTLNDAIFGTFSNGDHALIEVKGSPAYITLESATGVIIPNGSEVLITRISASDDSSNNKAWSSDGVTYITTSWSLTTTSIPVNNVNWIAVGCWIEINEPLSSATWAKVTEINEARNTITVATDVTFIGSNKPTINVYWAPDSDNFIEIPQSGFNARIVDDGDPPVDPLFKAGDVFTISTDGLVLKDDSKSRKVSVSLTSKAKHGKLDFPTIKNRFISPTFAEILTRNLLDFYKWPKYHLNLPMYHLPFIDFVRINRLASFKVISGVLFPFAKDFTRRFYLRSMTIDMKKNVAGLTLVDKDAY